MNVTLLNTVKQVLSDECNIPLSIIEADSNLCEDLALDSLDYVWVLYALERELRVDLPNNCLEGVETVRGLVTRLEDIIIK